MLEVTADALHQETQESIEWHKRRLAAIDQMLKDYQTPWHEGFAESKAGSMVDFNSKNHGFEYIALTIASTVFDNPRWNVTAQRGYAAEIVAPALQKGMNRLTRDRRMKKTYSRLYVEYCFSHCVSMVTSEEVKQNRRSAPKVVRPRLRQIGMRRAFRDHRCFDPEDCRYAGHQYAMDYNDLKGNPEWDQKAIKELPVGSGMRELRGEMLEDETSKDRGEVGLKDIYVPEVELPDDDPFWKDVPDDERENYHGTIYTLPIVGVVGERASTKGNRFLRPPRPWYGPLGGPYQFGGTYPVPDDILPLSNLVAVEGQNKQNNAVAKALFDAIVEYKRLIVTSHKKPTLSALIKRAKHGSVVGMQLDDLARMMAVIEVGGPTPALLQAAELMQNNMDRGSGISDAYRGNVTGDATAFENSIAMAGSTARMAYPKQQFMDFVGEGGTSMAWFLYHDDEIVMDLDGGAGTLLAGPPKMHEQAIMQALAEQGIPPDLAAAYIDFAERKYRSTPFEAFDFAVEPMSTERASDPANRQKMVALIPLIQNLAGMAPQMPWLNTKEIFNWLGQAMDMPDLGRVYNDFLAKQVGGMMLAQGGMQGGGAAAQSTTTPQARLGGDVGGGQTSPQGGQKILTQGTGSGTPKTGAKGKKAGTPQMVGA